MPLNYQSREWIPCSGPIGRIVGRAVGQLMRNKVRAVEKQHQHRGEATQMVQGRNVSEISTFHSAYNRLV